MKVFTVSILVALLMVVSMPAFSASAERPAEETLSPLQFTSLVFLRVRNIAFPAPCYRDSCHTMNIELAPQLYLVLPGRVTLEYALVLAQKTGRVALLEQILHVTKENQGILSTEKTNDFLRDVAFGVLAKYGVMTQKCIENDQCYQKNRKVSFP